MSMLSQTYIGKYYEGSQELSVSTKSIPGQDNDSYVILGESGYGKSVAAQSIVLQKANQSYSVRSIDIHNSSAPEHLFPIFRKSFEHLSSQIDAYNTPIPTTLFEPLHYADGTMESPADLSYTLSNIIANHLRLSRSSTAALSEALEHAISDRDNNPDLFPAVLNALQKFDMKTSKKCSHSFCAASAAQYFQASTCQPFFRNRKHRPKQISATITKNDCRLNPI